jgi:hypothetical protein
VGTVVPLAGGTESRNVKVRHQGGLPVRPSMIGRDSVLSEVRDTGYLPLRREQRGSVQKSPGVAQLPLPYSDRALMHSDCPSVLQVRNHRAFGIYRLPSPATGTASRSVFSLRNVSTGACPIAWLILQFRLHPAPRHYAFCDFAHLGLGKVRP